MGPLAAEQSFTLFAYVAERTSQSVRCVDRVENCSGNDPLSSSNTNANIYKFKTGSPLFADLNAEFFTLALTTTTPFQLGISHLCRYPRFAAQFQLNGDDGYKTIPVSAQPIAPVPRIQQLTYPGRS